MKTYRLLEHRLCCMSYYEFENLIQTYNLTEAPDDVAVISILEPDESRLVYEKHYFKDSSNVINLNFHDIIEDDYLNNPREEEFILADHRKYLPFTAKMAKDSVDFILNNLGKRFWIHCLAGLSRSQGFVRFILKNFPEYTEADTRIDNKCLFPNPDVVHKLDIELNTRIL